jgi:hypothetical protein
MELFSVNILALSAIDLLLSFKGLFPSYILIYALAKYELFSVFSFICFLLPGRQAIPDASKNSL